ncbi:MAG: hypothetical protein OEY79_01060 [Anaplasmataceae bacterium]|nr:hypothetical protein [Candidatus Heimdallarchaeota archaeon]MDH5796115.1 hypothetical protein [Anaplasmataceae bacterium]
MHTNYSKFILNHSLSEVNGFYDNKDINLSSPNTQNICFGRAVVNKRYKKASLSHAGFLSFNIADLQTGFDRDNGYNAAIEKAFQKLESDHLVLQNLSTGFTIRSDEQLKELQYTGIRKEQIVGYPIFLVEGDFNKELQYRFWMEVYPKLTGLAPPIMVDSGDRSYHALFLPRPMLSPTEHEDLNKIVAKIEWWEDEAIDKEMLEVKRKHDKSKKIEISKILDEFKKDCPDISDEIKAEYLSKNQKFNNRKNKNFIKTQLIKEIKEKFAKNVVGDIKKVKEKYKDKIVKFDHLRATVKLRMPGFERYLQVSDDREDGKKIVVPSGRCQEVVNENLDRIEYLEVAQIFEGMRSLAELKNPYYDIDPQDMVYISRELDKRESESNQSANQSTKGDYAEMRKQICEEKLYEIISFFGASHMQVNPPLNKYDIAPDDYSRGKKVKRGTLRFYSDTGFATIQSFRQDSEFNIGGKPLNITREYFKRTNFDLDAEVIKRLETKQNSFENVGKKEAKKKYNQTEWNELLFANRENLQIESKFLNKDIIFDFIKNDKENVLMLQGRTGLGKSSLGFHIASELNICNVVIVPFVGIRKGKYEVFYNDPSNNKKKLRAELADICIADEDKINNIIDAHSDKRIFIFCPEGYANKCYLEELIENNIKNNIKTLVTVDEGHSFLDKTLFRPSYQAICIELFDAIRKYGSKLKVILMSATMNQFTYEMFKTNAKLEDENIRWINAIPPNQQNLKSEITYVAHNNDPQEVINRMIEFYQYTVETGQPHLKCAIAISNVSYIENLKRAIKSSNEWTVIDRGVGIDLVHSKTIKGIGVKQSERVKRLYYLLQDSIFDQKLLDKLLSTAEADILQNKFDDKCEYLTKKQYETITNLVENGKDNKNRKFSAEYILLYIQKKFARLKKLPYIDELLNNNKLSSMFTFLTSSGNEGIDIKDKNVVGVIYVATPDTTDIHQVLQFFGRFRYLLDNPNFMWHIIIPNAKTQRRVQALFSVKNMFEILMKANGAYAMTDHDRLYGTMVHKNKLATLAAASEMLKRTQTQWIKNHDLITDFFAVHGIDVVKITVKDTKYYEALKGTENREIKLVYNKFKNDDRLDNKFDMIVFNNRIITWLSGHKLEIPKDAHSRLSQDFGEVDEITKQHNSKGHVYNSLRIKNFPQALIDYLHKLNLIKQQFDVNTCIDAFRQNLDFTQYLPDLYDFHMEQTQLLNELKDNIQGEDEEDTKKKQAYKSHEIRRLIHGNLEDKIKSINISFDKNAIRVYGYDPEKITITAMRERFFYLNYKDGVIISLLDIKKGYKSDEKAIKGILIDNIKNKRHERIIEEAAEIINTKTTAREEFKEAVSNYDLAILTAFLYIMSLKKTGKRYCWTSFEKGNIKTRKLFYGSKNKYRDCVTKKYNYILLNFIDTLKQGGKTRLIYVPFKIKTIKAMLLEATKTSPPKNNESMK